MFHRNKVIKTGLISLQIVLLATVFSSLASGQGSTQSAATPGAPAGAYKLSDLDSVNLYSGNLNFNMRLAGLAGRGDLASTVSLTVEQQWSLSHLGGDQWSISNHIPALINAVGHVRINHTFAEEPVSCGSQMNWAYRKLYLTFVSQDGTETRLVDASRKGLEQYWCGQPDINYGKTFSSTDGGSVAFVSDSDVIGNAATGMGGATGYLYIAGGSRSRVVNGAILWTIDRNGNRTEFEYDPEFGFPANHPHPSLIRDDTGREIVIEYYVNESAPYGLCHKITYKGFGGADRIIRVSLGSSMRSPVSGTDDSYELMTMLSTSPLDNPHYSPEQIHTWNQAATSVWLPDGRRYQFTYNINGRLAKVILPTGGYMEYDFHKTLGGDTLQSDHFLNQLKERRVYDEASQLQERTTYLFEPGTYGPFSTRTTVSTYDGSANLISKSRHFFWGEISPHWYPWMSTEGKEGKTEHFAADGSTLLRTIETEWAQRIPPNCFLDTPVENPCGLSPYPQFPNTQPVVASVKTTLEDTDQVSLVSHRDPSTNVLAYDAYGNLTDTWYYDFGNGQAGSFLKREHTDYVTDSNYTDRFLRSLPSETKTSSNSAGTVIVSRTRFEYDNYSSQSDHPQHDPLVSRSSVIGHDSTNYGTGFSYRGNVTAVTSYSNAGAETGAVTVYSLYDMLGNLVKTIDANEKPSIIGYEDNFGSPDNEARSNSAPSYLNAQSVTIYPLNGQNTFAFPTRGTNPLGWTAYTQVDYFTGGTVNTEDVNGIISKTFYNDPLDRPKQTVSAIATALERQAKIIYDDANRRIETRSDLNALNDNLLTSESFYDGLGRTIESRTYEAGGGYVATKSVPYLVIQDAQTLKWRVGSKTSNPYRPGAGEEPVWTTSLKDELGRAIKVITPDGAIAKTAYSGNATTVTDQSDSQRRSITNALGHLVRVDEPDKISGQLGDVTAPIQPTYYSYSAFGKMVHVQQGTQNRYFMYDSLGRLLRVRQPEQDLNIALNTTGNPNNNSWTAGFTYDKNGNVLTAIDAKGTEITNTYDDLNRPQTRIYSDGTPTVTNSYDGSGFSPVPARSKGKLTMVDNGISDSRYTAFDEAGRLSEFQQITDGQTYTSKYEYNLADALTKETYPSQRVVEHDYDASGELSKIFGKANPTATERTYANNFTYTPDGKIERLRLGNGVWESAKLNSRLQVKELSVGWGPSSGSIWKMNTEYGELQTNGSVDALQNSGNIGKQTVTFAGLAHPFVQAFTYDSLQRLTEAKETVNGTQTWREVFDHDRYGNRTVHQKFAGGSTEIPQTDDTRPEIDPDRNRFKTTEGYTFDKNGNVSVDHTGRQFTFNGDNKQTQVKDAQNRLVGKYFYDGEGKRVKKLTYDQYGVEKDVTVFVYSNGKLIAEYTTEAPPSNPTTRFTITDQLGSPRVILDSAGDVISRRDFLPFGEEIEADTTYRTTASRYGQADNVRQKFTGYQYDAETELDFAEARMYENRHGRFTAVDPLLASGKSADPQTFNRYVYVLNNPLVLTDPNGLQAGRWYKPITPDGVSTYRYESSAPKNYDEVTQTNKAGDLVGPAQGLPSGYELRFNPYGPNQGPWWNPQWDAVKRMGYTDYGYLGYDVVMTDGYRESLVEPVVGVRDVSLEFYSLALPIASLARTGISSLGPSTAFRGSTIANPVPDRLARVIAGDGNFTTLGAPTADDVFVTAADDIVGMNATQLATRLTVPPSNTFTVIEFPTPSSGIASPVFRNNPGFVGGGQTAGGAREFVIPNGPIPCGAVFTRVC